MVYITGDTHAVFNRFSTKRFPEQKEMDRDDYLIICGDFGGIWCDCPEEQYWLKWLSEKPFTILFVDGNHENFDRLKREFPIVHFHGGKAHKISNNIYHLMRGYVFELDGEKFFAFGGASSHDIQDGILDRDNFVDDYDFNSTIRQWDKANKRYRINHISWWKEELPSTYEMQRGRNNLKKVNYKVDYVISHCLPQSIVIALNGGKTDSDILTKYFEKLLHNGLEFKSWYCGHYHIGMNLFGKYNILYNDIERII